MNIFLVSEGAYSSYHIVAAFSTHESAEQYVHKMHRILDDLEIEIISIDSPPADWAVTWVNMEKDGTVNDVWQGRNDENDSYRFSIDNKCLVLGVMTTNKQQAIKSANEMRGIILANNLWDDPDGINSLFYPERIIP